MSPARELAFRALMAVESGAYAADFLAANSLGLESRDAGLAAEIVFGVLRYQAQLDHLIGKSRLDPEVRTALRMGIYQLRYLDRIPAHAAVNDSVDLVKRARKRSAAGLVNAVLRKVNRQPVAWPSLDIELSQPAWLLDRWIARFGRETAAAIARANLSPPGTYIRVPAGRSTEGLELQPTEIDGCFRLIAGDPAGFRQQDIGSQAIVPLLGLGPGMSFLDICAAPGNKTAQALESGVRAVACDFHLRRAAMLKTLGIPIVVLDGTRPLPFGRRFDRVLLDAPCSGTGTLARNPEIKWRLQPADLHRLHQMQVALLHQALQVMNPGGLLVYSTCSLEPEENEDVVATISQRHRIVHTIRRLPGLQPGDGFYAAVIKSDQPAND